MSLRPLAASVCLVLLVLMSSARLPQAVGQQLAPQTSPPALVPDDQFWDAQFGNAGTGPAGSPEHYVETLALAPNGDLYAGGNFLRPFDAHGVARWNGRAWLPLGTFAGTVNALTFIENDLYAGGQFDAGTIATRSIAKWNGSAWSPLGSGVALTGSFPTVHDIALSNGVLYVAGEFDRAGGVAVSNIARWDGTSWSAVGSGINGIVYDLAFNGTTMYAGGEFTSAGGVTVSNIARWDGTSWSALGSGTNGTVRTMNLAGAGIDVGGEFTSAGGGAAQHIARWNGSAWSALGAGLPRNVRALMLRGGVIYAGTEMDVATSSPSLYTWDGTTWTPFQPAFSPQGSSGGVYALVQNVATFYIGGGFSQAVGAEPYRFLNNVARWSGSEWINLGNAPGQEPLASEQFSVLASLEGIIYTDFDPQGAFLAWDGLRWRQSSRMTTSGQPISAMGLTSTGSQMYMVGQIGNTTRVVARWNGTSWETFGTMASLATIITAEGSNFYITDPEQMNGMATRLAKWNGTAWTSVTNVISAGLDYGNIEDMQAVDGSLYVAGDFTSISGTAANNVARWDGTAWSGLGDPAIGRLDLIAVSGTSIYVASYTSGKIAAWNGSQWTLIGTVSRSGSAGEMRDLAVMDGQLYITGFFDTINGVAAKSIARWNGSAWFALGSGLTAIGTADTSVGLHMTVDRHNLYISGLFTGAGGHESIGFARWNMDRSQKTYFPLAFR